jgi:CubicO group peptidase (beta-lactamase class C family)
MLYKQGKVECKPVDVDYNEERLEVLKNHFNALIEDNQIYNAVYCISRRGKVFAHGAIGYETYKKDPKQAVSPTDIQYIASMTKPFTGVAVMKLFEDGLILLDTPVGEILPQFDSPPFNTITVSHLLTHSSGMHPDGWCFPNRHNYGSYWRFVETAYEAYKNDKSKKKEPFDWIAAALAFGVREKPGKEWMYCSFGFVILGEIIRKISGVHPHEYIINNICKPLGMKDTTFKLTPAMAKRYIIQNKDSEKYAADTISGKQKIKDPPWDDIPETGGGMKSTVWDAVRFGNMVLGNGTFNGTRIMGRKAVEKMTDFAVKLPDYCWGAPGTLRGHGLGFDHRNSGWFSFSENTVMHEGYGACALYVDPTEELVASWFAPSVNTDIWCQKAMYGTVNVIWSGLK